MGHTRGTPSLLLLVALVAACIATCSGLPCPANCSVAGRGMDGKGKTLLASGGQSLQECISAIRNLGISFYEYSNTKACYAFSSCSFIFTRAGSTTGNAKACPLPPPPPAPMGYCSATRKNCRCRKPLKCLPHKKRKICCCPANKPFPIFTKKRQLAGCKA